MVAAFKAGSEVALGIDHPHYRAEVALPGPVRTALRADFA